METKFTPIVIDIANVARWTSEQLKHTCHDEGVDSYSSAIYENIMPPFSDAIYTYPGRPYLPDLPGYISIRVVCPFADGEFADENRHESWHMVTLLGYRHLWREWLPKKSDPFIFAYHLGIDDGGKIVKRGYYQTIPNIVETGGIEEALFDTLLFPVFFAISLLHCKNVALRDALASRQVKRQAKRRGTPLIKRKVLVIEPFKRQVRKEARETGESEIQRALHICRGHFRTYSEDKPLFGKVSGTFWIPMHARGSASQGVVEKDYRIDVDSDE